MAGDVTLDTDGAGRCPLCGSLVRGEPHTLLTYWHPVEACRDRLVVALREREDRIAVLADLLDVYRPRRRLRVVADA